MYYELNAKDIHKHIDTMLEFHCEFANFFCSSTRGVAPHALD